MSSDTLDTIVRIAAALGACGAIGAFAYRIVRWVQRQNEDSKAIRELREEQCLLTWGVLACLKGLKEQGCNGPVTEAINKIEKHVNKAAHHYGEQDE